MSIWKAQALLIAMMLLGLAPLLIWLGLPVHIEVGTLAAIYFVAGSVGAVVALFFFYVIAKPRSIYTRLFIYSPFPRVNRKEFLSETALPVLYLFFGLLAVFSYSFVVSTVRPYTKFDPVFLAADRFFLLGHSVDEISKVMMSWPLAGPVFEASYYQIGAILGATLLWLSFEGKRGAAMNFCCDIINAYLIAVMIYWIAPSMGPFIYRSIGVGHTAAVQAGWVAYMEKIHAHRELFSVGASYFVAFPSMHMAQSALIAWHLRSWPRLLWAAVAFNVLSVAAIIGLQWHYAVDILGGLVVAGAAVAISRGGEDIRENVGGVGAVAT